MKEIEVKILEIDVDSVIKKLESLGAVKEGEFDIEASHYDFDKEGVSLRLRKIGEKVEFTSKKKIDSDRYKIRDEFQVEVDDFDKMDSLLKSIGLGDKIDLHKKRISYVLVDVRFEIDTYDGIPTFLEIEAPSEEELEETVEMLGFSMSDAKPWSWKKVLKHYGKI